MLASRCSSPLNQATGICWNQCLNLDRSRETKVTTDGRCMFLVWSSWLVLLRMYVSISSFQVRYPTPNLVAAELSKRTHKKTPRGWWKHKASNQSRKTEGPLPVRGDLFYTLVKEREMLLLSLFTLPFVTPHAHLPERKRSGSMKNKQSW
jgi:hypothetical protein